LLWIFSQTICLGLTLNHDPPDLCLLIARMTGVSARQDWSFKGTDLEGTTGLLGWLAHSADWNGQTNK
jgi:hypothetical protein